MKDKYYHYDLVGDFQRPSRFILILSAIGAVGALVYGLYQILTYEDMRRTLDLVSGIVLLIGSLFALWAILRGNKPLLREGQVYLKIENGILAYKKNALQKTQTVDLNDDVRRLYIGSSEVILGLDKGKEIFIEIQRISRKEKRTEFLNLMQEIQQERYQLSSSDEPQKQIPNPKA